MTDRYPVVSIPFIAGQWSLRASGTSWKGTRPSGFNPLHCGAVVASPLPPRTLTRRLSCFNPLHCGAVVASLMGIFLLWNLIVFQSPSLRGSGRFGILFVELRLKSKVSIPFIAGQWSLLRNIVEKDPALQSGFNPLHCGAVVASCCAWRPPCARRRVSIPFIAGQWSLPVRSDFRALQVTCFNPLHCGAVVASSLGDMLGT